ncbi:bifunctional folylpolyglutamate synthase/dihydrofolate synthase [Ornithinibacillus xuwenensis]|uniref:tetrahydrofolate synthase n=1 Tax=Ornithinibacillus xuwenensis TaxID=3144668 RepID=A0ABU9XEZ0_9BACI
MFYSLEEVQVFFDERKLFGIKPGLDRMVQLLASQQNPEKNFKSIHIAGTNGKGSTVTYLKDSLKANHYRVGVFTSPSLDGLTGHIMIDDRPISEEQFLSLLNQLLPTIQQLDNIQMHATEFEILTVIAFMYFSEAVDIALIEAGMGGREDSTNCIVPILSIITNIEKDHAQFLGDTIEKIAYQKAGIMKQNVPTVLGNVHDVCLPIIYQEAKLKQAKVYQLHREYEYCNVQSNLNGNYFNWLFAEQSLRVTLQMQGFHQIENASTALMAMVIIEQVGFPINWEKVLRAMSTSQIAGRFERLLQYPCVWIDGAHNLAGMNAFLHTTRELSIKQRKHLVFAGFHDKELVQMIELAIPYFDSIILTTFDHPRAEDATRLANHIHSSKISVSTNWQKLINEFGNEYNNDCYFFAGSLHFIGMVRAYVLTENIN